MPAIDPRIRLSALWSAMLFVFAYVDIFSLYRQDVRDALDENRMFVFTVDDTLLLGMTVYILLPSLMVFLSLVLPRTAGRIVQIVVGSAYALSIVAATIGERPYYVLGSAVEVVLLVLIAITAVRWAKPSALASNLTNT